MFDKFRKKILRTLKIDHIAAVDKPAQQGAVAVLQKNAGGTFQKSSPAPVFISDGVEVAKRVGDERPRRNSFIDHAHGPAHYRLLSRFFDIKNRHPSRLPEENYQEAWNSLAEADRNELRRADAVPNDDLDLTEKGLTDMDNSSLGAIIKQFGFEKFAKHVAENGASISEAEFVAAGNAHYGKDAFTKMIATDATIYAACRKLNDIAIAKFDARWFPNGSGTAEKVGYGGGELASLEPISRVTSTAEGLTDDFKAMVEREMATAPWLSVKEAEARCNYAIRAKEEANKKRRVNASA